jgi:glutamate dehydrogenase/leucine dehydrogenase
MPRVFSMENIENLSLDIFSPCALGESITIDNYFKFNTKYIIGERTTLYPMR